MNTLKKHILSVLLIAFTFFVIHDYFIDHSSLHTMTATYTLDEAKDTLSLDHDKIHAMFEVSLERYSFDEPIVLNEEAPLFKYIFLSFRLSPLDKPPVI